MYSNIIFEKQDDIAVITLNRPKVLNALSSALKAELLDAFGTVAADSSTRALVLTGAGKAFSAGQDLNESKDLDGAGAEAWVRDYQNLYDVIRALDVPVIAAVSGWAVGAGLQIALLADIRLCSGTAKFAMPEIKDGIPAIFGLALLANVIGMSRAVAMVLTGEPLNARAAVQAGLVTALFPQARLLPEALALAHRMAAFAPLAMQLDKQWARQLTEPVYKAMIDFATDAHRRSFEAGDAKRGMEAFLQARQNRQS